METQFKRGLGPYTRQTGFEVRKADEKSRTIDLSFSSEEPVRRGYGLEILDHGSEHSVDLRLHDFLD